MRTIVSVNDDLDDLLRLGVDPLGLDGHDLLLKLAGLESSRSLLERARSKRVLDIPGNTIVLRDVLARDTHRQQAIRRILVLQDLLTKFAHSSSPVSLGHALDTRTDTNVDLPSLDLVGDLGDGSQTRGALAVDGVDGGLDGDACVEGGHARSGSSSTRGEDIADGDVVDELGVKVGALVSGLENVGKDELGFGIFETSLATLETWFGA